MSGGATKTLLPAPERRRNNAYLRGSDASDGLTARERGYSHGELPGIPEELYGGQLDAPIDDGDLTRADVTPDPDTDWQPEVKGRGVPIQDATLPEEPRWKHPPRTILEAYQRAYARLRFWQAMMRPPVRAGGRRIISNPRGESTVRVKRGREWEPTRRADGVAAEPLFCQRCGAEFFRRKRGPVPRYCDECRRRSRNA